MKRGIFSIVRRLFVLVLVAVVGLLAINNAAFYHLHKLSDGRIVAHAHPFTHSGSSDGPIQSHKHSQQEYLFFDSILVLFVICPFLILAIVQQVNRQASFSYHFLFLNGIPQKLTNKAPPFLY